MPVASLPGLFHTLLGWMGIERTSAGGVSLTDPIDVAGFEVADRWVADRRTAISSGESGGGGGGPYRIPKIEASSADSAPVVIDLSGDGRLRSPAIHWNLLSRPEYRDFIVRHSGGFSYEELRALFEYESEVTRLNLKNGIVTENASELLLLELQANLEGGGFRLRTLAASQFSEAVSYLRHQFLWPIPSDYVSLILSLDEHYDRLEELNPDSDGARIRYHQDEIRTRRLLLQNGGHELQPSDRVVSLGLQFRTRVIENRIEAILPRLSEIRERTIRVQVHLLLPEALRSNAYDRFAERVAWLAAEELRHLPPEDRERLYREELMLRGVILSSAAPESLVLRRLEGLGLEGHGLRSDAERDLLREGIERRRDSCRDDVTEALAAVLRRQGRMSRTEETES